MHSILGPVWFGFIAESVNLQDVGRAPPLLAGVEQSLQEGFLLLPLNDGDAEPRRRLGHALALYHPGSYSVVVIFG